MGEKGVARGQEPRPPNAAIGRPARLALLLAFALLAVAYVALARGGSAEAAPDVDTFIDTGPSGLINDDTPTFTFSSNEFDATFECQIDGGGFTACTSPETVGPLADGLHTFEVQATDAAALNTDPTPASRSFTVDTTAPAAPTLDSTNPSSPSNVPNPSIIGSSDPATTVAVYDTASCSGAAQGSGSASAFAAPGIAVSVPNNSTSTFRATATDAAGNSSACSSGASGSIDYSRDSDAPNTTIDTGPSGLINDDTPTFTFSSNEPGSTFECRIDGGGFSPCTSPETIGPLADGAHLFEVRATDSSMNTDLTPASRSFTVDTTAPAAPSLDSTNPSSPSNVPDPRVIGSSDTATTVEVYDDASCSGGAEGSGSASIFAAPGIGVNVTNNSTTTFRATATDAAGNTSACSSGASGSINYTHDSVAPNTTIVSGPAGVAPPPTRNNNPSFTFSSSEPGSSFECRLVGAGFSPCTSPQGYSAVADGDHTFDVRATDAAGNTGSPDSWSWTIDTTPPNTGISSGPAEGVTTADNNPSFSFLSSELGSTFECSLDLAAFAPCTSPESYSSLADGDHIFLVRATDEAGNTDMDTPASRNWTIDKTPPNTTITAGPAAASTTTNNNPSFSFDASQGPASFQCKLDGGNFVPCTAPRNYLSLADGPHTFSVRATDNVGNTDPTPAVRNWTIDTRRPDTEPPETTITGGPEAGVSTTDNDPSFDFASSEAGSSFECKLDSGSFNSCTPAKNYTDLGDGEHSFSVRATDIANNTDLTPASRTWTVDTGAAANACRKAEVKFKNAKAKVKKAKARVKNANGKSKKRAKKKLKKAKKKLKKARKQRKKAC